jgi:hypothetical protein
VTDAQRTDLSITVAVRCPFKADLGSDVQRADALEVLDAKGERLQLYRISPTGTTIMSRSTIENGRSAALGVEDCARTLVLLSDGVEVERLPLALTPGRLTVVNP